MSKRIPLMDLNFLIQEAPDTPMHVGGLLTFTLPDDAPEDVLQRLAVGFRDQARFTAPWNLKVSRRRRDKLVPRWVEEDEVDLDHHFRHIALPQPGGERELGVLVSRLQSIPLDISRPLWELYLIEGLAPNRFALYLKIHHAIIDGTSLMRLLMGMLSDDADVTDTPALWMIGAVEPRHAENGFGVSIGGLYRAATGILGALARPMLDADLVAPFTSPRSPLSAQMNGQRRFATKQLPLADVKAAAAGSGSTVNDMVLWLCSSVLQRYLDETGTLPGTSLNAAVPVNLRETGDYSVGSNIGHLLTSLATDVRDPRERLEKIKASSRAAKHSMQSMPREARYPYTFVAASSMALGQLTRLDTLVPPMFSLVISNVPGPATPKYLHGAKLESAYPISLLMRGGALNITVVSLDGVMNFGFVGARDTVPHLQRMTVHLEDAMKELLEITTVAPTAGRGRKRETAGTSR